MKIEAKTGQKFSVEFIASSPEGVGYNLDGFNLTSKFTGRNVEFNYSIGMGITITNASTGVFEIEFDLTDVPTGSITGDIKYSNGAVVDYSEKILIDVKGVITP